VFIDIIHRGGKAFMICLGISEKGVNMNKMKRLTFLPVLV